MSTLQVTIVGAGIIGLWQAFELARRGHGVTLREAMPEGAPRAASTYAGAMLAPYCESESAPALVRNLGIEGLALWQSAYPGVRSCGSLVVAGARDRSELDRFARMTQEHRWLGTDDIADLEPQLDGRFSRALYFSDEAHVVPRQALAFLLAETRRMGADVRFGDPVPGPLWQAASAGEAVIDCRGLGARHDVPGLRGVRGEMVVVHAPEVALTRPVRLLHPRFPLYVVPWDGDHYMIGATMIESEDLGPVTVRSALDLLGAAYTVSSGLAEAQIVELGASVRPAFADNVPRIVVRRSSRVISVNGAYRHGYLLAPVLASVVADLLENADLDHPLVERRSEP